MSPQNLRHASPLKHRYIITVVYSKAYEMQITEEKLNDLI